MRIRTLIGLTAACLLATACAHDRVYMGGDMGWTLNESSGEGLKLAYGEPQTDNLLVMMTCQPRSGEVLVSLNTTADARPLLVMTSGGRTARYPARIGPNLGDGAVVEAVTRTADPVLASFARSGGALAAGGSGGPTALSGGAQFQRFLDSCRA